MGLLGLVLSQGLARFQLARVKEGMTFEEEGSWFRGVGTGLPTNLQGGV